MILSFFSLFSDVVNNLGFFVPLVLGRSLTCVLTHEMCVASLV